jgi:hypothetical protein
MHRFEDGRIIVDQHTSFPSVWLMLLMQPLLLVFARAPPANEQSCARAAVGIVFCGNYTFPA